MEHWGPVVMPEMSCWISSGGAPWPGAGPSLVAVEGVPVAVV